MFFRCAISCRLQPFKHPLFYLIFLFPTLVCILYSEGILSLKKTVPSTRAHPNTKYLDSMILEVFSNLWFYDSMILSTAYPWASKICVCELWWHLLHTTQDKHKYSLRMKQRRYLLLPAPRCGRRAVGGDILWALALPSLLGLERWKRATGNGNHMLRPWTPVE